MAAHGLGRWKARPLRDRLSPERMSKWAIRAAIVLSACLLAASSCGLGFSASVCRPPYTVSPAQAGTHYLRFYALGDTGSGNASQQAVADSLAQFHADFGGSFALLLGDNFYEDGVSSTDDPQWASKFEDMYDPSVLDFPFYAVLGNHDYHLDEQAQVDYTAVYPASRWEMPARYYAFSQVLPDGTRIDFFGLDGYTVATEDAQLTWLQAALAASTADWKIVFSHYPLYSNGVHGDNPALISRLSQTLADGGVDLYVSGHDHDLQILEPVNGTCFMISGAGSRPRDTQCLDNTVYANDQLGFMAFRVSKSEMVACVVLEDAVLDFCYTLTK